VPIIINPYEKKGKEKKKGGSLTYLSDAGGKGKNPRKKGGGGENGLLLQEDKGCYFLVIKQKMQVSKKGRKNSSFSPDKGGEKSQNSH